MRKALATVMLSLLMGCHTGQTRTDGPPGSSSDAVQVMAQIDGTTKPVSAGQSLRSGTQFSVTLKATKTSYVYVALVSGSRMPSTIVPASGESAPRIEAGKSQTFPASGQFTLDEQPGTETVVAVFAPEPLSDAQIQSLLEGAESAESSTRTSGEKTRDVPPIATTATRGITASGSSSDASGTGNQRPVVSRISFAHTGR